MTDLINAPQTTGSGEIAEQLAAARDEITRLTDSLRWVEHCRAQAEESVQDEKEATKAANERADAEADRADGAESHLRRVLVEYIVEPALGALDGISDRVDTDEVPDSVLDSVAESLMGDLDGGLDVVELPEAARGQLHDWAEEQR